MKWPYMAGKASHASDVATSFGLLITAKQVGCCTGAQVVKQVINRL
jgi:DhnA family fructose-bisphosphate aldolase class Ia